MSSASYPSSLSHNLVRTSALAYRENAEAAAGPESQRLQAAGSFPAFPDFSREPGTRSLGQFRLATLAAASDSHSPIGPRPF